MIKYSLSEFKTMDFIYFIFLYHFHFICDTLSYSNILILSVTLIFSNILCVM